MKIDIDYAFCWQRDLGLAQTITLTGQQNVRRIIHEFKELDKNMENVFRIEDAKVYLPIYLKHVRDMKKRGQKHMTLTAFVEIVLNPRYYLFKKERMSMFKASNTVFSVSRKIYDIGDLDIPVFRLAENK